MFYSQDAALTVNLGNQGQAAWTNAQATKLGWESEAHLRATKKTS